MTQEGVAIARLEERLASYARDVDDYRAEAKIAHSELKSELGALNTRERERNGHINDLVRESAANKLRWDEHMKASAEYIAVTEQLRRQHEDADVKASLLRSQWVMLSAGAALGASVFEALNRLGIVGF